MKITDEMRDSMLFKTNVLGQTATEAGRELGCSGRAVRVACLVFEAVRDKNWNALRDMYSTGKMGLNTIAWAESRTRVDVPKALKQELADMQQRLKEKYEAPKSEPAKSEPVETAPVPETAPTGPKVFIPAPSAELGWQTRIKVQPDKVCMMVYFNGIKVVEGWSRVKGDKELDLMQAISYAAHMCYKQTEQKKLGGR